MADRVDGILLSRDEARRLVILARLGAVRLEARNGCIAPGLARLLEQLEEFGRRNQGSQVSAGRETANGLIVADPADFGSKITVTAAAARLGVSPQTIRCWCRGGDLIGWRPPAGGPWIIDGGSVATLAATRNAGKDTR